MERDGELALISAGLALASNSMGSVQVVEGPPGIGKTALCEAACDQARAAELNVLKATGSVVEQDFSYGVVRQLFEPLLRGEPAKRRTRLFSGQAGPAASVVLGLGSGSEADPSDADGFYALLHGLFGLTANLAADTPLALVIDDGHWADPASQRYLLHLARRIEGLPIFVFIALRGTKPGAASPHLAGLLSTKGVSVAHPAPLSEQAVGEMVGAALGHPDSSFVSSCYRATGGIPYFVRELLATLVHDEVQPTSAQADRVAQVGPLTVAHATLLRLGRLGASARSVAAAVSVLGSRATVPLVGALTALAGDEVLATVESLIEAGIFAPGRPLRFAHPILQASVYEDLPPGNREMIHLCAAQLLIERDADPEDVAAHLLATSTGSPAEALHWLEAAAKQALERGAPESAIVYLRRLAADTPRGAGRVSVLHLLGRAELLVRDPQAAEDLRQAMTASPDPRTRASIACDLADVLGATGCWEDRIPLISAAIDELTATDLGQRLELERRQAGLEAYDTRYVSDFDRREAERHALVDMGHPAGRELALLLGGVAAWRCKNHDEIGSLLQRGLDGGRLLKDRTSSAPSLSQAVGALVLTEQLEEARSLVEEMFADAMRRGSPLGCMQAHICRVWVRVQSGDLTGAEEDLRAALEVAGHAGDLLATVCALRFGLEALMERRCLADLADMALGLEPGPGWQFTMTGCFLFETRGHLRLDRGEHQAGIEDLRAAGSIYQDLGVRNPLMTGWRSKLALEIAGPEANELVSAELATAESSGYPRAISRAYRTKGLLHAGASAVELLEKAEAESERCPSRLEVARCRVELGALLRRSGQRVSSRPVLTSGMRLAESCGAELLAARALEELRLAGAKPRRRMLCGLGSLTPAEERVAHLASQGMTNRAIARLQFVSPKTVENQLGQIYRKLGISGRSQLSEALKA